MMENFKNERNKFISLGRYHCVQLCLNGTVIDYASDKNADKYGSIGIACNGQCDVFEWDDIVEVSAGSYHTLGLKKDGTVIATNFISNYEYEGVTLKRHDSGQCETTGWENIKHICASERFSLGVKENGAVVGAGYPIEDGAIDISSWRNIVYVAAGPSHVVGLKSNGTVVAAGEDNKNGRLNVAGWRDIVSVCANSWWTIGLKSDGAVVYAGNSSELKWKGIETWGLEKWKNIVQIDADNYFVAGLCADGTVIVGSNDEILDDVSSWRDIVCIEAGNEGLAGIGRDGTIHAAYYRNSSQKKEETALMKLSEERIFENYDNLENERKEQLQRKEYRSKKLCQHCGGKFKGLFSKKCIKCGKLKDY